MVNEAVEKAFKRELAVGLSQNKLSVKAIAEQIEVNRRIVHRWINEFRQSQRFPKKSPGRPKKTTDTSNR